MSLLGYAQNAVRIIGEFGISDGVRLCNRRAMARGDGSKVSVFAADRLGAPLSLRMGNSDWHVLNKVFVDKEYEEPSKPHAEALERLYRAYVAGGEHPVVVDCGANVGLSAIWYARRFPRATVIAIEPEPRNFELLKRNVGSYGNVVPIHAGIAGSRGRMSVVDAGATSWAFQVAERPDGDLDLITIRDALATVTDARILLVKVDIEGFEDSLFASNTEWIEHTPLIVLETHDWLFPWRGTSYAVNTAINAAGRWDKINKGENEFYYSHRMLLAALSETALVPQ